MLTRIRIEAEGATVGAVQEDLFASYDALLNALFWPNVVSSVTLSEEVYEQTGSPSPDMPRWYKGRMIATFTNRDSPFAVEAKQMRGRTERLERLEAKAAELEPRFPAQPDTPPIRVDLDHPDPSTVG